MGAPRKYFTNGAVLFVTFGLEQGLLLLANPLCKCILRSGLARALSLYPVRLSHFIVNQNHVHMIFVVINPIDACKFVGHFKAEVAHRINALFGWKKRTVWCEGYDSPVALTPVRALLAIAYLYANPAKDNHVTSIDDFPGMSSWEMFTTGKFSKNCNFVRRLPYRCISSDMHNLQGYSREAARLSQAASEVIELRLEPNAWMEAFGISEPKTQAIWNERLIKRVRTLEARAQVIRRRTGAVVTGATKLKNQILSLVYKSERKGRRTYCISESRTIRISFLAKLKALRKIAREVFQRWHCGDFSIPYPPGLFPPSMPRLVELVAGR